MDLKTKPAFKLKFASDKSTGEIAGYGSVVGNVDSYGERVMPGAFRASLEKHRRDGTTVKMLWQHRSEMPIGNWLELREDSNGLFCRGQINRESSWGRDAWAAISDGNADGLSIGYREVRTTPDGVFRNLDELDLFEVSPVTFPANNLARVTSKAELAEILIKSGLSRAAAAKIAGGGWPALSPEDNDDDADLGSLLAALKKSSLTARTTK